MSAILHPLLQSMSHGFSSLSGMRDCLYNLRIHLYGMGRNSWDQTRESRNNRGILQWQSAPPNMSDIQANDGDVLECSPRDFAEAQASSRRTRRRPLAEVDLEPAVVTGNKRRRFSSNQTITNSISMKDTATQSSPPPPPPKEPTFSCPICMAPFVEETSTKCGHIFCKECIKTAIRAKPKCPTCRTKVTMRGLIRVFLPTAC